MRYSVTLPASRLTLEAPGGGAITSGGTEAGEALLRQIMPGSLTDALDAAIEKADRRRTGALVEGITGTSNTRDTGYRTVQRYLQRVRNGEIKKQAGILRHVEQYQDDYRRNTGHKSSTLEQMRRLLTGEQLPRKLPDGKLTVKINGNFLRYPGGRGDVDIRRGPIQFEIPGTRRAAAMVDPVAEWLASARYFVNRDFEILEITSVEMIFDDKEAN